jgi:hypothetical protein
MPTQPSAAPSPPISFFLRPVYLAAAVLGWLVPGAGFWLLGYRVRALLLGVTILGLFWAGEIAFAGNKDVDGKWYGMAVSRKVSPIFFILQAGNGLSAFYADHRWGEPRRPVNELSSIDPLLSPHHNLGVLCTVLSGLLNLLVVLHVLDPRTWAAAEEDRRTASRYPRSP